MIWIWFCSRYTPAETIPQLKRLKIIDNNSSWNNIFSPSKDLLKVNNKNRGVAKTPTTIWNEEQKVLATPLKTLDYCVECVQSEQNKIRKTSIDVIKVAFTVDFE